MDKFDLNFLKSFYYVVTLNGFTHAAEKLNVQQPVVSRAIKLLEGQLGFKLIERQKRQVLLTREGHEVFRAAEKLFASAEEIGTFARERRDGAQGDLSFATSDSLAPELMGTVLRQLHHEHPGSRLPLLYEKYKATHKSASIVAVSSSSMARKAMALNGLGVTILPSFLVSTELKQGRLKTVHEGDYLLPLYLVERKSSYRSKVKNALLALIKDAVDK